MKKLLLVFAVAASLCGCDTRNEHISIVPYPNHMEPGSGSFAVAGQTVGYDVSADSLTVKAVVDFAGKLGQASGVESQVVVLDKTPDAGIRFVVDQTQPAEGYNLDVTSDGVTVRASGFPGFFYAIQSMKQLLPVEMYTGVAAPAQTWEMPCVKIVDAPRFGYRGMHLDVARHFFSVEEVKRYIDMLAVHKLNILHWHLTDDQGWRIEIKKYPELTTVGGVRKATVVGQDWSTYDNTPYGGSYTQDEIRDVVKYAADRAITIIPEIDLPGHMQAALAAYPDLGCTGGPYDVWGRWGVSEDVLCVGQEKTFEFLDGVLAEVIELFPSEYIHIGGDECPKVRWEKCPRCQQRARQLGLTDRDGHKKEHFLQNYVMDRVEKFLAEHGRRVIGWDEILEGEISGDATVMSWRGSGHGIEAAKLGHDAIMVPNSHFYFDYYQSANTAAEPFGIGGYIPIQLVYAYEPFVEGMTPEQQAHILGIQANIWSEYIATDAHLEYMLLPRLAALSEVQWCNPGVRDWDRFLKEFKMGDVYKAMNYNFAKHIYGVMGAYAVDPAKRSVTVTLVTQGDAPIYYTLDGSEPTAASQKYVQPIELKSSCKFRAKALREDMEAPEFATEFDFNKATGRNVLLNSAPTARYLYGGPTLFTDGHHGKPSYTCGDWIGFLNEPCDITIDMEGSEPYSSAEVENFVQFGEWVFPPSAIKVSTSDDGVNFTEVAALTPPQSAEGDAEGIRNFCADFPQTSARYLRIVAETVNPIPAWHGAAGEKGHMFIGEISVE